jgi:aspartate ammonia-lyase
MNTATTRLEHDLLGDKEVPTAAYYGVHTLRALENFPITGITIAVYPDLIRALAQIKRRPPRPTASWACSTQERMKAIVAACDELVAAACTSSSWWT